MKKSLFVLSLFTVLFTSCFIGLGEAVDLNGPSVTIESPRSMETVPASFSVSGTVKDESAISSLTLTCDEKEWKYSDGVWQFKDSGGSWTSWNTVKDALGNVTQGASWTSIGDGAYFWKVTGVTVNSAVTKEFIIKVSSSDEFGNVSADSVKSRAVIYDITPPLTSISSPALIYNSQAEISAGLNLVGKTHHDLAKLSQFVNQGFTLSGVTTEESTVDYVKVAIRKSDGTVVYGPKKIQTTAPQNADEVQFANIRSWSLPVEDISAVLGNNFTYLEVLTECADAAGNYQNSMPSNSAAQDGAAGVQYYKSQGWFCYWPDADKPWTETDVGDDNLTGYPGSKIHGQSFDDDGVTSVEWKIYKGESESGSLVVSQSVAGNNAQFVSWNIELPTEPGKYYITVKTTEKNGKTDDSKKGKIVVKDINSPSIRNVTPLSENTLFGNSSGNFSLSFEALDDNGIDSVKVAYIQKIEMLSTFLNASSTQWNTTSGSGYKVWTVNPSPKMNGAVQETDDSLSISRKVFTGSLDLNLFTDLGIDGTTNKLNNQNFVFLVKDKSSDGSSNCNVGVLHHSVLGDVSAPSISITNITRSSALSKPILHDNTDALAPFTAGETLTIEGTWSEDSADAWKSTEKLFKNWTFNGVNQTSGDIILNRSDKTWKIENVDTSSITSGLTVKVTLTDYAGNSSTDSVSYVVELDSPELVTITSDLSDGTYTKDQKIPVTLKFNKPVKVVKTSEGNSITLTMNNGQTAEFKGTYNTFSQNLDFEFTTSNGKDTAALDVTSINLSNVTITDGTTEAVVTIPAGQNLVNNRTIKISTAAPKVTDVSVAGSSLTITFDKEIADLNPNAIVEIVQNTSGLKLPAFFTNEEFNKLKVDWPAIEANYKAGTMGDDVSTRYYILSYEKETNDSTLTASYIASKCHVRSFEGNSSSVSYAGNKVTINLSDNPLPCLGAEYTVKVPAALVYDGAQNYNDPDSARTITLDGTEKPVIRVERKKYKSFTYSGENAGAVQPTQASYKIDCETPGKKIMYKVDSGTGAEYNTSDSHILGADDYTAGSYVISAWIDGNKAATTVTETAYKTVVCLTGTPSVDGNNNSASDVLKTAQVWIRGSDVMSGVSLTPGFPLSWNDLELDKVHLMTKADGKWYYVTWEVKTKLYSGFMLGELDSSSETKGPSQYTHMEGTSETHTSNKNMTKVDAGGSIDLAPYTCRAHNAGKLISRPE